MARLPQVGGDKGSWGQVLNDYLATSHNDDGTLKNDSIGAPQLKPSAVTAAAIANGSISNAKIADGAVNTAQLADNSVTASKFADAGQADGIATLDADARLPETQIPERLSESALMATLGSEIATEGTPAREALNNAFVTVPAGRRVIFDDDWYTDVDQVIAARILGYYQRIGVVSVIASIIDTAADNASAADAALRYEGITAPLARIPSAQTDLNQGGPYLRQLARLPHLDRTSVESSTTRYRKALASSPDNSVDIISAGYLNALHQLLLSPGDGIDARNGLQLVAAKVRHLWMMGGSWPSGSENNFSRSAGAITSASYVVTNWPGEITFLGYEVGSTVVTGGGLDLPPEDPVRLALTHSAYATWPTGRPSWDGMLTELACIGDIEDAGYTAVQGTATVNASTGYNTFVTSPTGKHRYVVKALPDADYVTRINNLLVPGRQPDRRALLPAAYPTPTFVQPTPPNTRLLAAWAAYGSADGDPVERLQGQSGYDLIQPIASKRPVYKSGITDSASVTRKCVRFASGAWLKSSAPIVLPGEGEITVYAMVRWEAVPSGANQTVASMDWGNYNPPGQNSSAASRSIHLGASSAGKVLVADFSAGNAGATTEGPAIVANLWTPIVLYRGRAGLRAGVAGAVGAIAYGATDYLNWPNHLILGGAVAQRDSVTSEPATVDVAEVRIYSGSHSTADVNWVLSNW